MAYTIIGQNNTTTTVDDGNGHTLHIPSRVALAIGTTFTITEVNNNMATLEDSNGKVYRDIPCVVNLVDAGGSGGDEHNLGWYATESALTTAHPTATDGDWAIVGATDTVWVWDSDSSAWVDTDTKGQVVSVNSKTGTVVLTAEDVNALPQYTTMPVASSTNAGEIVLFVGTTNASYTHGYIYENVATPTYSDSVEFNPASISGTVVTATTGALAGLCEEYGSGDITDIIKGTLTYDQSSDLLVFVGLDDTDTQVCTFQLYEQDYEDAGFTFTGTLADGDVINFTCTITESASYAWTRIDVQPTPEALPSQTGNSGKFLTTDGTNPSWATVGGLPSQTGNSGKFLTTDGTDASWSDKPLVNKVSVNSIVISNNNPTYTVYRAIGVGYTISKLGNDSLFFGYGGSCTGKYAIQLGSGTNSDDKTVKIYNGNGNFEIMSADGTIPADRLASTSGLADGNYRLRLTMASGVPTLTWVAE